MSEDPLRHALLQRLANDLAVARFLTTCDYNADPEGFRWSCCWIAYWEHRYGRPAMWLHRICPENCPHWHHHCEITLAG